MTNKSILTVLATIILANNSFSQNNISLDKFGTVKNIIDYKKTIVSLMQSIVMASHTNAAQLLPLNSEDGNVKYQTKQQ
jgi:hypothetical protein